jgi:DNA-directed RNA polymerase specialized sigma24 family protein
MARARLGDERLASEIMELAIQQTVESLADMSPVGIEETQTILARLYRNELRRRLRSVSRLSYRGSSAELEYLKPSEETTSSAVEAEIDLERLLRETPLETRIAMLLRYGARSRWKDVAQDLAKSTEATRKACEREMERIRKALGL